MKLPLYKAALTSRTVAFGRNKPAKGEQLDGKCNIKMDDVIYTTPTTIKEV